MIEYRIRKDEYAWSKWYVEKIEDGVVVVRYDFPTEAEAREAISDWQKYTQN